RLASVLCALAIVLLLSFTCLMMATQLHRFLGVTGLNVISWMVGVLITTLAVQFVFDGSSARR
ncbi:MAG: MarC family protein, partial [Rhodospirillales bacterium]